MSGKSRRDNDIPDDIKPRRRSTDVTPPGSPRSRTGERRTPLAVPPLGSADNPAIEGASTIPAAIPASTSASTSAPAFATGTAASVAADPGLEEEAVFAMVLRLVRAIRSGMQSTDPGQGMSGSQLWAMWQISAQPGLRVADLADALHIQPSTASNLLDKLEARAWVRRERRDTDSRVVRLLLTAAGADVLKTMPGPLQGRLRSALRELPPDLRQGLYDGLVALVQHMDG